MSHWTTNRRSALKLAAGVIALPYMLGSAAASSAPAEQPLRPGRDQYFDDDWRFWRGSAAGAEAPDFDDSNWRRLDLPHDWSIEDVPGGQAPQQIGPFDRTAVGTTATGYTIGGEGWYRKHFRLAPLPPGARVEILFEGVQGLSDLWINGHPLGGQVHGYTPFAFDLTPHLVAGANVLAVRARNIGRNSRWYAGSGIYRPVRIDVIEQSSRIGRWGVAAWTRRITGGRAEIDIVTELAGAGDGLSLRTRLLGRDGRVAAEQVSPASSVVRQSLTFAARLWSPANPALYTLESALLSGSLVIDRIAQPFGVRIVAFDAVHGTTINGEPLRLRGGCVHHDNGLLGAATFAQADERRILLLKARGYNALRSSHNPASRSFREACDRHGMLLIEEAFDTWFAAKEPQDYSNSFRDDWRPALAAMVKSARNSPSVIMWSIGNEVPERSTAEGVEWAWRLANEVRGLDPTRPVTAALNGVFGPEVIAAPGTAPDANTGRNDQASSVFLDIAGYNYLLDDIEPDHERFPHRILYASETFPKDAWDYQRLAERAPYMLGEFVWTAMDYVGEAGIGASAQLPPTTPFFRAAWPWVIANCGDIDLIGDQRAQSRVRDVIWGLRPLAMAVQRPVEDGKVEWIAPWGWSDELESWTWPGATGKSLAVRLYTSGDRVELRLNGRRVGEKALTPADKGRAEIIVPYAPGALEGIAFQAGREIGRKRLETVGAPAALRLTPERTSSGAGRQALSYAALTVVDAAGRHVPDAGVDVSLAIDGPAELIGFGCASPLALGSFQATTARTYHGRALAILRSRGVGQIRVEARSAGLSGGAATIRLR